MKWESFGAFFILTSLAGNFLNRVFLKRVSLYVNHRVKMVMSNDCEGWHDAAIPEDI
jgi:hypothetical protein